MAGSETAPDLTDEELAELVANDPQFAEFLRSAGQRSVEQLDKALSLMMSETAATMRWILGALLTINGGGIVVLSSASSAIDPEALRAAVGYLTGGCVMAIFAALLSGLSPLAQAAGYGAAIVQWHRVAIFAEGLNDAIAAAKAIARRGLQMLVVGCSIGLVSLGLFVAGAWTAGDGFGRAASDNVTNGARSSLERRAAN